MSDGPVGTGYSPRHPRRAQVANYNMDNPALDFILDELDPQPSNRRNYNRQQRRDPSQPMPPSLVPSSSGGGSMIRRFVCRFCGYVATSAGNRDKHERVHTGEKTIQCAYCEYATADTSNYNRHLRRKHGVEPEGPPGVLDGSGEPEGIQCPYCAYATPDVDDFDRHVRIRHNGGD